MAYELMPPVDQVWIDLQPTTMFPGEPLYTYNTIQVMEHGVPGFTEVNTFANLIQPQHRLTKALNPQPSPFPSASVG